MFLLHPFQIRYFILAFFTLAIVACSQEKKPNVQKEASTMTAPEKEEPIKEPERESWPELGKIKEYFTEYGKENPETKVRMKTRLGDIVVRLYEDTPLHRANFVHHVKRGLYHKTIFYRVVPGFMIQGGNSDNDETLERRDKIGAYYIPSEVKKHHIHRRGALAMAMSYENNPEMKSAQYSFYIVIGTPFSEKGLKATEEEYGMSVPDEYRNVYLTEGGTPHLDGKHTVFGEVIEGMDVVEAIAAEERDSGDWPITDVVIEYEVLE